MEKRGPRPFLPDWWELIMNLLSLVFAGCAANPPSYEATRRVDLLLFNRDVKDTSIIPEVFPAVL